MRTYRVELVRESGGDELEETILRTSTDVARALWPLFEGIDREKFVVALLDAKHSLIAVNTVSIGSLTASIVCPREVFRPAVLLPTAAVVLAHNHPSGDPSPSGEDIELTKRLREVGELLGIRVLDHVILGGDGQDRRYRPTRAVKRRRSCRCARQPRRVRAGGPASIA
jgi:DNA repair protein RadC